MRRIIATALTAVLGIGASFTAAWPARAAAGPAKETPEGLYDEGRKAFRIGDYETAVKKWERAYALSDNALLLYNISLAYKGLYTITKDLADLRRARAVIDNFITIAKASDDVDVDDAEEKRAELDEMIREAEEAEAADEPRPAPPRIEDGDGEPKPMNLGEDPGRKLRIAGIATMAGGGAVAITGLGLTVFYALKGREFSENLARDNSVFEDDCVDMPSLGQDACDQFAGRIDFWRTSGRRANNLAVVMGAVLGGVGVVGLVAGGLVFNEGNKRTKQWEGAREARVLLLPSTRGVVLTGTF